MVGDVITQKEKKNKLNNKSIKLNIMLNFLSKKIEVKKVNKAAEIEQKSELAISVFKSTLDSLISINEDVETEITNKDLEIDTIKAEINILVVRQVKNKNFINKLNEFFQ